MPVVPAHAGTTGASLWDSYNVASPPVSKTYAAGGTSARANVIAVFRLAVHIAREHSMLDIVMLALALGFFVAGIGYAYACERL